jgi:hypothetical protein
VLPGPLCDSPADEPQRRDDPCGGAQKHTRRVGATGMREIWTSRPLGVTREFVRQRKHGFMTRSRQAIHKKENPFFSLESPRRSFAGASLLARASHNRHLSVIIHGGRPPLMVSCTRVIRSRSVCSAPLLPHGSLKMVQPGSGVAHLWGRDQALTLDIGRSSSSRETGRQDPCGTAHLQLKGANFFERTRLAFPRLCGLFRPTKWGDPGSAKPSP